MTQKNKEKKKIGIITLNGYHNYGNRLQNYALEQTLKSLGFTVKTIIKKNQEKNLLNKVSRVKKMTLNKIQLKIKNKILYTLNRNKIIKNKNKKKVAFKKFSSKYLSETNYSISPKNISKEFSKKFDYFITGSDQVWKNNLNPINFLTFAPEKKRIAYAPSFGVQKIRPDYIKQYKKWLSRIPHLSVREESGAKIIKKLTGKNVPVLIDPTMILAREKWLTISKTQNNITNKKYLLTYILGELSKEQKKRIRAIAQKHNLKLVNLMDVKNSDTFVSDPIDFINYIKLATLVYTDSFHGTIFSLLFKTPFIVFNRYKNDLSMFSRIENLLEKFKLKSRIENNIKNNEKNILDVDFSHCDTILNTERKKAYQYLKKALKI